MQTQLIFVDPAVKINGATTVMCFSLNSYCLSCRRSRETSSCSRTVLQRTAHATQSNFLNGRHPRSLHQPPVAPIVKLDNQWTTRYGAKCSSGSTRQKFMTWMNWSSVLSMDKTIINNALLMSGANVCVRVFVPKGHFEHLLWLKGTHDNFSVLSLCILKENCCYCVKYVRFLKFLIFCISQGNVATRLGCGGNNSFVANFLLSPPVKEFKICQHSSVVVPLGAIFTASIGLGLELWCLSLGLE